MPFIPFQNQKPWFIQKIISKYKREIGYDITNHYQNTILDFNQKEPNYYFWEKFHDFIVFRPASS